MLQDSEELDLTPHSSVSTSPVTPANERDLEYDEQIHFVPKRAMASFENLVALANYQEGLKGARKIIWRDRGQPVVELATLEQCLKHALRGGLRSAGLAFSIRALINLVLAMIRIGNVPRDYRPALIRHALFGEDTWRFSAMLGSFTSLYKFLINALPILIPALSPSEDRLPLPATAPNEKDTNEIAAQDTKAHLTARAQMVIRKRVRRWHAALAGCVAGGLAIMCEKGNRRGVISQQMFVRGLQGSYNAYAAARNLKIPYGDVIVFSLACGQIVYAWLMRRDTLPKSYSSWITEAAKVPPESVRINHDMVRTRSYNIRDLTSVLGKPETTVSNKLMLLDFMEHFNALPSIPLTESSPYTYIPSFLSSTASPLSTVSGKVLSAAEPASWYIPFYAQCRITHPAVSSCALAQLDRFFEVSKWMLPIYGALHFVPAVLFKMDAFKRDPGKVLVKAGLGSLRSSAFLGVLVALYQTIFCYKHKLHRLLTILRNTPGSVVFKHVPQWLIDWLISKPSFWLTGMCAGLSLLVEAPRRRGELAMYVLPKGLESAWVMARGKGLVFTTGKWGDVILTAMGMGMVMSTYQNDPQHLSGLVRRILYQFIGPN